MRVYDDDGSGALQYPEFEKMFGKLREWRQHFYAAAGSHGAVAAYMTMAEARDALVGMLGEELPAEVQTLVLDTLIPDDGSDCIYFPQFVRMLAEMEALSLAIKRCVPRPRSLAVSTSGRGAMKTRVRTRILTTHSLLVSSAGSPPHLLSCPPSSPAHLRRLPAASDGSESISIKPMDLLAAFFLCHG